MSRRKSMWMLAVLALVALRASARAESWALVVGVNDCPEFRLPDGSRPRALRGAEGDAQAFAAMLAGQFHFAKEHIRQLQGRDATRDAFTKALGGLLQHVQAKDSLVLYFAGHGTQLADQRPLDETDGLDEALCLADSTAGKNLVRDDELGRWLETCKAGQITVILDCCHAGTGIKDPDEEIAARFLPMVQQKPAPPGDAERQSPWQDLRGATKSLERRTLAALFACQPDQQAYERRFPNQKPPARSGQFTRYLLAALKENAADTNADGQITASEATAYINRQLDESFNHARATHSDRQQSFFELTGDEHSLFGPLAADR